MSSVGSPHSASIQAGFGFTRLRAPATTCGPRNSAVLCANGPKCEVDEMKEDAFRRVNDHPRANQVHAHLYRDSIGLLGRLRGSAKLLMHSVA